MADLTLLQSSQLVSITGADSTGLETNPVGADSSGNLNVVDKADGPVTPGTVAGASSLIGGQYNSSLPTLTNGQQVALQVDPSGRLIVSSSGVASGVADKTIFTYGTSVQQTVGGVFQDTSPTLSAGQSGTVRLNTNRALHSTLRDPTTDVGITSDNNGNANNQRLHTAVPDTTTASTALGALNATVQVALAGLGGVGFQINAGTLIGTLTPELSIDGGTTWIATSFFQPSSNATISTITFASANTTTILSIVTIGGTSHVRVRVSAYTSGTANSILRAANSTVGGVSSTFGGSAAIFGTANLTYPVTIANTVVLLLAANSARKYAMISSPSTSIQVQLGTSTGLTTTTGFNIPSGGYFELKGDNLYTGNIYGISSSAKTISVTEGTP